MQFYFLSTLGHLADFLKIVLHCYKLFNSRVEGREGRREGEEQRDILRPQNIFNVVWSWQAWGFVESTGAAGPRETWAVVPTLLLRPVWACRCPRSLLRQGVWVEARKIVGDFACCFTASALGPAVLPGGWVRTLYSVGIAAGLCTGPAGKGRSTRVLASDLCLP